VQAIEIETKIDENGEILIKLPPRRHAHARVIVLLDTVPKPAIGQTKHRPSPRLANRGAKLHGDDIAPALSLSEWGGLYL